MHCKPWPGDQFNPFNPFNTFNTNTFNPALSKSFQIMTGSVTLWLGAFAGGRDGKWTDHQ